MKYISLKNNSRIRFYYLLMILYAPIYLCRSSKVTFTMASRGMMTIIPIIPAISPPTRSAKIIKRGCRFTLFPTATG